MLKIMLDPGHGAYTNRSPLDGTFYEGTNNYKFALALREALLAYEGVEVLMTRLSVDEDPAHATRGGEAVKENCDVFLSLHSNASSSADAYGVEGYYSVRTPAAYKLLVGLCHAASDSLPKPKVRRVVTKVSGGDDYYGVLRASAGVKYSMLIEMGFHTNAGELACIRLGAWHEKVAAKMANEFASFFELEKKKEPSEDEVSSETGTADSGSVCSVADKLRGVIKALQEIVEEIE